MAGVLLVSDDGDRREWLLVLGQVVSLAVCRFLSLVASEDAFLVAFVVASVVVVVAVPELDVLRLTCLELPCKKGERRDAVWCHGCHLVAASLTP